MSFFLKKGAIEDRMDTDSVERIEQTIMRLGGLAAAGGGMRLGDASSAPASAAASGPNPNVALLEGMGFTTAQAQAGLNAVGGDVERAAAWILDHPESAGAPAAGGAATGGDAPAQSEDGKHVHQALCNRCKRQIVGTRHKCKSCADFDLCDACFPMRIMWHDEEHDFHDYDEELQVEQKPKKELTEEEKAAEVARLKELMEAKRQMREEEAKRLERENELKRRVEAKNTIEQKRKWEEQKVRMEQEKIRRQKEKEEAHKQAVLQKIRRERGAKLAAANGGSEEKDSKPIVPVKRELPSTCTVQIRGKTGTFQWEGSSSATVAEVASFVQQKTGSAVTLVSSYPKVIFSGGKEHTTLADAGLAPRGLLLIQ